jgi:hypothetical protein
MFFPPTSDPESRPRLVQNETGGTKMKNSRISISVSLFTALVRAAGIAWASTPHFIRGPKPEENMKRGALMKPATFAALSGFGLMLVPASPAFAGISNFSIDQPATLAANGLQATVTGTVRCPGGTTPETASIIVQVQQIHSHQILNNYRLTPVGS